MFDTTIMQDKINRLKDAFEGGEFSGALLTAIGTGKGLMEQRIFRQNEDTQGQSFGTYIGKKSKTKLKFSKNRTQNKRFKAMAGLELTSYQRKRAARGRQVIKKDLEFSGGLRFAIESVVESEKSAVLQFNNTEAALIAKGQEQQIANIRNGASGTTRGIGAVKIFGLNTSEKEQVTEQGLLLITQILKP